MIYASRGAERRPFKGVGEAWRRAARVCRKRFKPNPTFGATGYGAESTAGNATCVRGATEQRL